MQNGGAACESTLQGCKMAAQHAKALCKGVKWRRSMRKHFAGMKNGGAACESIFQRCKAAAQHTKGLFKGVKERRNMRKHFSPQTFQKRFIAVFLQFIL